MLRDKRKGFVSTVVINRLQQSMESLKVRHQALFCWRFSSLSLIFTNRRIRVYDKQKLQGIEIIIDMVKTIEDRTMAKNSTEKPMMVC